MGDMKGKPGAGLFDAKDPAHQRGAPARVGVIASVTRPFYGTCDGEITERWTRAVAVKLPGHGINNPGFLQPSRPMSAVGG
jgi:GTP 3',8-cyclase